MHKIDRLFDELKATIPVPAQENSMDMAHEILWEGIKWSYMSLGHKDEAECALRVTDHKNWKWEEK